MKRARAVIAVMAAAGLWLGIAAARADTALVHVTPETLKASGFRLTSRAARNDRVAFTVHRDVRNVDGPGRKGYLSHAARDEKGLGTPVKLEERDGILTFRFQVPAAEVRDTVFTLWGQGLRGEGVTHRFRLGNFWKPKT